jgi:predicted ATPase/DNA-binding XRE family transcriptional regulator
MYDSDTDDATHFGRWLSRQRKARDLTQEVLAERIGCSLWYIQKIEAGSRRPSRQVADMLADYFRIPATEREAFLHFARGRTDERSHLQFTSRASGDVRLEVEHPNNLPVQLTSFVGRAIELPRIRDLMLTAEARLLTLTGPPGTGKTRLALEVASQLLRDFEDGVFFVNLAPITDHHLVIAEIAQTLAVQGGQDISMPKDLEAYLRNKHLLLILDNFEQVVEAGPEVGQLLMAARGLKVIVTSRMPMHIRGEKEYSVPPLHLPDLDHLPLPERLSRYEAIELFIQRARDVGRDFELTADNASAVAHICARLDGLPLAIELAAARIKLLAPQAMLSHLQNRLKLLSAGAKDLPTRQQTLRSAIEWSYGLLSAEEKRLFRRLAIFQGGRTLEAVEAVCNAAGDLQIDVLDGVSSLLDKSLLGHEEGVGGDPRFVMLETIHEFAREKLQESGENNELGREHARYFMRLAEEAEPELEAPNQLAWLNKLQDEHDNMRAAIGWCAHTQNAGNLKPEATEAIKMGLRLAGALGRFWLTRGYLSEGRQQLDAVLALEEGCTEQRRKDDTDDNDDNDDAATTATELMRARAKALSSAGTLAWEQGDNATARTLHSESLAISRKTGDKRRIARSLYALGNAAFSADDYATARSLYEESLALHREFEDKRGIAIAVVALGALANKQGDYATARPLYEEGLALMRELGNKRGIAHSLSNLASLASESEDYASVRSLIEDSLTISRELGDKRGMSKSLFILGRVAHKEGSVEQSKGLFAESVALSREIADWPRVALWLAEFGGMTGSSNQPIKGTRLLAASEAVLESAGDTWGPHRGYNQSVALVRSQLDEEAFEKAWQEGWAMSMEQAVAYALEA